MPEYLSPGVYVEEIATGPVPIEGVSTSTAGFLGETERGPVYPQLVSSWLDYQRVFGGYFGLEKYMPYSIKGFFDNGGKRCFVGRITAKNAKIASIKLVDKDMKPAFTIKSVGEGEWGNRVAVEVGSGSVKGFSLKVYYWKSLLDNLYSPTIDTKTYPRPEASEIFDNLSVDDTSQDYIMYRINSLSHLIAVSKEVGDTGELPAKFGGTVNEVSGDGIKITLDNDASEIADIYKDMFLMITDGTGKGQTRKIISYSNKEATISPEWMVKPEKDKSSYSICQFFKLDGGSDIFSETGKIKLPVSEEDKVPKSRSVKNKKTENDNSMRDSVEGELLITEIILDDTARSEDDFYKGMTIKIKNTEYEITGYDGASKKAEISNGNSKRAEASPTFVEIEEGMEYTITRSDQLVLEDFEGRAKDPVNLTTSSGLTAFEEIDEISIVYSPNCKSTAGLPQALIAHCERMKYRFLIMESLQNEAPQSLNPRSDFETEYAAFYYPWIKIIDPGTGNRMDVPPGGHVAGIYARSDVERGVYKAPANEKVTGAIDLFMQVSTGQQDVLNPRGVNVIRFFTGRGILVWGARTLSSNTLWKYINVRRLFSYIEKSIDEGTQWVVFEPNDEKLWDRVKQSINVFLTGVWNTGGLMGTKPEEAFFVTIDRTSMTQDDINNGRLIGIIGIAPVRPAEFVIFRFTQMTASISS